MNPDDIKSFNIPYTESDTYTIGIRVDNSQPVDQRLEEYEVSLPEAVKKGKKTVLDTVRKELDKVQPGLGTVVSTALNRSPDKAKYANKYDSVTGEWTPGVSVIWEGPSKASAGGKVGVEYKASLDPKDASFAVSVKGEGKVKGPYAETYDKSGAIGVDLTTGDFTFSLQTGRGQKTGLYSDKDVTGEKFEIDEVIMDTGQFYDGLSKVGADEFLSEVGIDEERFNNMAAEIAELTGQVRAGCPGVSCGFSESCCIGL